MVYRMFQVYITKYNRSWKNNATSDFISFTCWAQGSNEPNGDGPCMEVWTKTEEDCGRSWNDVPCHYQKDVVCEIPM